MFFYGGHRRQPPPIAVHALRDATGRRCSSSHAARPAHSERLDDGARRREPAARVRRADARAGPALPAALRRRPSQSARCTQPIQRCLARSPRAARPGGSSAIACAVGAEAARRRRPPTRSRGSPRRRRADVAELVPLARRARGLAMLSYTRLAHDPEARPSSTRPPASTPLAIDAPEFDVDDARGRGRPARSCQPGIASGLLLHDVLELARSRARRDAAADSRVAERTAASDEQLARAARQRGIAARYLPHAARLVHGTLTAPLALVGGRALPIARRGDRARARGRVRVSRLPGMRARPRARLHRCAGRVGRRAVGARLQERRARRPRPRRGGRAQRAQERYGVQARLYAIAAERLARRAPARGPPVRVRALRHDRRRCASTTTTLAGWTAWLGQLGRGGRS